MAATAIFREFGWKEITESLITWLDHPSKLTVCALHSLLIGSIFFQEPLRKRLHMHLVKFSRVSPLTATQIRHMGGELTLTQTTCVHRYWGHLTFCLLVDRQTVIQFYCQPAFGPSGCLFVVILAFALLHRHTCVRFMASEEFYVRIKINLMRINSHEFRINHLKNW